MSIVNKINAQEKIEFSQYAYMPKQLFNEKIEKIFNSNIKNFLEKLSIHKRWHTTQNHWWMTLLVCILLNVFYITPIAISAWRANPKMQVPKKLLKAMQTLAPYYDQIKNFEDANGHPAIIWENPPQNEKELQHRIKIDRKHKELVNGMHTWSQRILQRLDDDLWTLLASDRESLQNYANQYIFTATRQLAIKIRKNNAAAHNYWQDYFQKTAKKHIERNYSPIEKSHAILRFWSEKIHKRFVTFFSGDLRQMWRQQGGVVETPIGKYDLREHGCPKNCRKSNGLEKKPNTELTINQIESINQYTAPLIALIEISAHSQNTTFLELMEKILNPEIENNDLEKSATEFEKYLKEKERALLEEMKIWAEAIIKIAKKPAQDQSHTSILTKSMEILAADCPYGVARKFVAQNTEEIVELLARKMTVSSEKMHLHPSFNRWRK